MYWFKEHAAKQQIVKSRFDYFCFLWLNYHLGNNFFGYIIVTTLSANPENDSEGDWCPTEVNADGEYEPKSGKWAFKIFFL